MSSAATAGKLAYVVGMLAIASAGTVNMITETAKKPDFSLARVKSEEFQKDATSWFDQHWGLRGVAIKTDNTINDSLFHETRTGQPVRILENGVLINPEDITYLNRTDGPEETIKAAKKFAVVQRRMREKGKLLLPMILPSKTSFIRDDVPPAWRREGAVGMTDQTVYGAFVDTLKQENALFVDGRAVLHGFGDGRFDVFPRTGRHWDTRAACFVLQHVTDKARKDVPRLGDAQVDCHTKNAPLPGLGDEEYDLFRLLNIWAPRPADVPVYVVDGKKGGEPFKVPTLFIGSSFLWKMVRLSRELEVYRPSLFYYYDRTVFETEHETIVGKVEPFTPKWREETFSKDLYVMDVLETYLPVQGQDFLSELEKELDDPRSPINAAKAEPTAPEEPKQP